MSQAYQILLMTRTPFKERNDAGILIESMQVSFSPIFSPIKAESPELALTLAQTLYPLFRFVIAVQEQFAYARQSALLAGSHPKNPVKPARSPRRPGGFSRRR